MGEQADNKLITRQAVLWNMAGSVVSALASFLLLLFVTRTVGADDGGLFSLAYSTAQILLTFGKFGIRSYQATDVNHRISAGTYLMTRVWFCLGMILLDAGFIFVAGYSRRKCIIFLLVCVIKMVDALEDVFHGQLQLEGRLDKAGQLLFIRNVLTIVVFGGCMYGLNNLTYASLITAIVSVISACFMNVAVSSKHFTISFKSNSGEIGLLLKECLPLFVGTFLSLYIYNVPKYVIDSQGTSRQIAVYTILFMPTFVINLLSDFIFKPLLTNMAYDWDNKNKKSLIKTLRRQFIYIAGIMIIVLLGAYLLGTQILSAFYKVNVNNYRIELMVLMLAGGGSAVVYLLYNVLTCMRKQVVILINYGIGAVIITVLALVMMNSYGIMGEAIAYLIAEIILAVCMLIATVIGIVKDR